MPKPAANSEQVIEVSLDVLLEHMSGPACVGRP